MKTPQELHQELRQRTLKLPGVTERENAGIHEDAYFVGRTMFMHIHDQGRCDIRLSKTDQERVLADGRARPHRWAPQAGYVTSVVTAEKDLGPTMDLIQMSHQHFSNSQNGFLGETNGTDGGASRKPRTIKLLVIGATGRTGHEIVQQALARGHQVTAFVRSPDSITLTNERLTVVKGDAMDESQLAKVMQGHNAVLSALGPREVFKPGSILHDSALATTRAMKRSGVKRLVVLSAAAHFPGLANRIASFVLQNHMRDSLAMEEIVQASGLDWTIARPPRLTEGDYVTYRCREEAAPPMGLTIARKAVAAFVLDAIERKEHFERIVGIAK